MGLGQLMFRSIRSQQKRHTCNSHEGKQGDYDGKKAEIKVLPAKPSCTIVVLQSQQRKKSDQSY